MKQTEKSLIIWGKKVDISKENYRVYVFPEGDEIRINTPEYLIVSDNGHRIADSQGISHYIPYGWIHLYWENVDKDKYQFNFQRPGQPTEGLPMLKNNSLNRRQKRYCRRYVEMGIVEKAAIHAGYNPVYARFLMTQPKIKNYIQKLLKGD